MVTGMVTKWSRPNQKGRGSPSKLREQMPELSRFRGILIAMYFNDHAPPHFHARYSGQEVKIAIDGLDVLDGELPGPQMSFVREWAELHQDELRGCWEAARRHEMPERIDPLP